jgi:ketosteroid isomerase-like protein
VSSVRIAYVRRLYEAHGRGDDEAMLALVPKDVVWQPVDGEGVVCRSRAELEAFFARRARSGVRLEASAETFEEVGESVVVSGSARLFDPGGGFREVSVVWIYAFAGDVLRAVQSYPSRAEALMAIGERPAA